MSVSVSIPVVIPLVPPTAPIDRAAAPLLRLIEPLPDPLLAASVVMLLLAPLSVKVPPAPNRSRPEPVPDTVSAALCVTVASVSSVNTPVEANVTALLIAMVPAPGARPRSVECCNAPPAPAASAAFTVRGPLSLPPLPITSVVALISFRLAVLRKRSPPGSDVPPTVMVRLSVSGSTVTVSPDAVIACVRVIPSVVSVTAPPAVCAPV